MTVSDFILCHFITFGAIFIVIGEVFSTYLKFRQVRFLRRPPSDLCTRLQSDTENEKTIRYSTDKFTLGLIESAVGTLISVILFTLRTAGRLYYAVESAIPGGKNHPYLVLACYIAVDNVVELLTSLPFSIYRNFVLEARWGFNKHTPAQFAKDLVIDTITGYVQGVVLFMSLQLCLAWAGPRAWAPAAAVVTLIIVVMQVLAPVFLKMKFEMQPLSSESLLASIKKDAVTAGFAKANGEVAINEVDSSKRSSHGNAFAGGLGAGRMIVVYDSLIAQCGSEDEIAAVVAHELGHQHHKHIWKLLLINTAMVVGMVAAGGLLIFDHRLYEVIGYTLTPDTERSKMPLILALNTVMVLGQPLLIFIMACVNYIQRVFEYQADSYAVRELGRKALPSALVALHSENLSAIDADPVYAALMMSHPPLVHRLRAMTKTMTQDEIDESIRRGTELREARKAEKEEQEKKQAETNENLAEMEEAEEEAAASVREDAGEDQMVEEVVEVMAAN